MVANIDMSNGRANMAYVGDMPWHGLGAQMAEHSSIDAWIEAAGLNWTVERANVQYQVDTLHYTMANRSVLYRSDTHEALSVMSKDKYKVVQPREIVEFFSDIISSSDGEFDIETAGSLDNGKKIWCMAKAKHQFSIKGQDTILPYLLLTTACDGTLATVGKFIATRVVCSNTMQMAINEASKSFVRVPHSRNFDASQVKTELMSYLDASKAYEELANRYADVKVTDEQATDFFARLYGPKKTVSIADDLAKFDDFTTNQKNTINALMTDFHNGPGANLVSAKGTVWGLVNAVTHYHDHDARTRTNKGTSDTETRFNSAQFGAGNRAKQSAIELANDLLETIAA